MPKVEAIKENTYASNTFNRRSRGNECGSSHEWNYGRSIETAQTIGEGRLSLFRTANVCDLSFESALDGFRPTFSAGDHAYVRGGNTEPPCHPREHSIKTPVQLERRETSATVVISSLCLCHIFLSTISTSVTSMQQENRSGACGPECIYTGPIVTVT